MQYPTRWVLGAITPPYASKGLNRTLGYFMAEICYNIQGCFISNDAGKDVDF
jgi:hypothetical protein